MAFQSHLVKIAIFLTLLINLNSSLESFGKAGDPNQATSNYGKTFYVTFNHNPGSLGYPILTLAAESRQASVTVRCLDVSCMFQVSVSSKNTTDVSLPSSIQTKGMGFTNRVVQVTSTENIAVWGNNYRSGSIDSFLVLPRQLYGKRYVVAGYRPTLNSQLSIVASEQDTQINITFPAPITYNGTHYDSQTPLMMMLKAKMAFKYFHQFEDLTGTMITSSQDIAVYSGNECANVPFGQPFCDHLIEQLPSVDDLGTRYIVAGFGGRLGHDIVRITSAMPYTMVYLGNGTSKSLPTRGSHFEFEVNSGTAMYLNCSRPCLLTQYTKGRSVDSTNSDPMMIYIPAIDQYSKDYLFRPTLMLGTEIVHYITIIIEKDQVSGLTLDGNPINSSISWVQAMGTQYVAAAIQVSGLDHQLRHSNPLVTFALLIYGHERVSAYGMLGGVSYGHHCNFAGVPGDLIDNDCDGRTDEELYNGIDDDNDGRIDEDLYRPFPTLYLPQNYTTITCQPMQFNASTEITGMASVGNIDPQCNNDTDIIPYYDDTMIISPCGVQILRKWSVADSCGNVVSGQQSIIARMAGQQSYQFPNHTSGSCPINSSLALNGQPIIEDPTDCPEIQIPQPNVTYQSISVFRCAYYVERIWTITPELLCGPRAQFKQLIRGYDEKECPKQCVNGASCVETSTDFQCLCAPGYTGRYCTVDIDECASNPCRSYGPDAMANCTQGINLYTCSCPADTSGESCEQDLNSCFSNPCLNGATCMNDGPNKYNCTCAYDFFGHNCAYKKGDAHHIGKDFYIAFMENVAVLDTKLSVTISSQMATTVSITCAACRPIFQTTQTISNGTTVTIQLPNTQSIYGVTYSHRIFNIHADQPITVRGYTAAPRSTESYLALPLTSLGLRYIVASYPSQSSEFVIIGTANRTKVTINFPTDISFGGSNYSRNQNYTITLQQLQAYQFQSDKDLTGTIINANQPIAVFSGDKCANVEVNARACDHLVEQLVPVRNWDTQYASMYIYGRKNISALYRVIASEDNVDVTITGKSVKMMQISKRGGFIEFLGDVNTPVVIRCSQVCSVYQYNRGGELDFTQYDPFLTTVPGFQQFYKDYLFNGPTMSGTSYMIYINIIVDTQLLQGLRLDGQALMILDQSPIPDTNFTGLIIRATRSSHSLRHINPNVYFSAMYYAFSYAESYGMPLGINARHQCVMYMNSMAGNGIDDDCDGRIDEEKANGIDDDGDGRIDEDLATNPPKLIMQTYVDIRSCQDPNTVDVTASAIGQPQVMTDPRCNVAIPLSSIDTAGASSPCGRTVQRLWTISDTCGNNASVTQTIVVGYPEQVYQPPADFTYKCPASLDPVSTGQIQVTAKAPCSFTYPAPVIQYSDEKISNYCSPSYKRTWTITPSAVCGNGTKFVQYLRPENANMAPYSCEPLCYNDALCYYNNSYNASTVAPLLSTYKPYGSSDSNYTCFCGPKSTGMRCNTTIIACQSNPCIHGTCSETAAGFACQCSPGYEGVQCQSEINECASNPCSNGQCIDLFSKFVCHCNYGYSGPLCNQGPAYTQSIRLINGGRNDTGAVQIFYNNEWGTVCNKGFDTLDGNVICRQLGYRRMLQQLNTSALTSPVTGRIWLAGLTCYGYEVQVTECGHGGFGQTGCLHDRDVVLRCYDYNECASNPCVNGYCSHSPNDNGYTCSCFGSYTGTNCDAPLSNCNSTLCTFGTCIPTANSFTCNCANGFSGQLCDTAIWSEWEETACSVSCGPGFKNRTRSKCASPNVPSSCEYQSQTLSCNLGACPTTLPPPTTALPTTQAVTPTTSGTISIHMWYSQGMLLMSFILIALILAI